MESPSDFKKSNKSRNKKTAVHGNGSQHNKKSAQQKNFYQGNKKNRTKTRNKEGRDAFFTLRIRAQNGAQTLQTPREYAYPEIEKPDLEKFEDEQIQEVPHAFTDLIDDITQAKVSFEEAIELIKKREELEEGDSIVYIGAGRFGIMGEDKNSNQKVLKKKIEFEKQHDDNFRQGLKYDLGSLHIEDTKRLSDLYTDEEIQNFKLKSFK